MIDMVFRRSEGIPYFVEELTRSAARGCIDMPDTLRDALNVRVQTPVRRGAACRRARRGGRQPGRSSNCSRPWPSGTGVDLDRGLREAIDAAVLTADETGYSFRHALLREVMHDDLLPGQHARLHARFAALHGGASRAGRGAGTAPLEIAHHWSAAHEVNKAFRWSITAARSGSAAYHEALQDVRAGAGAVGPAWRIRSPIAGSRAVVLKQAAVAAERCRRGRAGVGLGLRRPGTEAGPDGNPAERIKALI